MTLTACRSLLTRRTSVSAAAGAVALLLASVSGEAADLGRPYMPFAPPVAYNWSGFYVGAQGGYGWGRDTTTEYFTAGMVPVGLAFPFKTSGYTAGGHVGYNYQVGSVVMGLEGDFEGTGIKGGFVDTVQNVGLGTSHIEWQGSVRGRIGYAFDRFMIYGTGGYSFANIAYTFTNRMTNIVELTESVRSGWTAGIGAEYAITPNVTARLEYRHANYGTFAYDSVTSFPGLTGEQKPRVDTVRAGVSFRF